MVTIGFRWDFRGHRVGKVYIVGFGELRVGVGGFWGGSMAFVFFFRFRDDPVLFGALFDVFWGLHLVSLGFLWSSCWKSVNCGFWRTSGRFRLLLAWIYGFWGISFVLVVILFFWGLFLTSFWVSVWY